MATGPLGVVTLLAIAGLPLAARLAVVSSHAVVVLAHAAGDRLLGALRPVTDVASLTWAVSLFSRIHFTALTTAFAAMPCSIGADRGEWGGLRGLNP